jgi:nucleotide-binding universal stress UspA family protein
MESDERTILVAVDFSYCSRLALRTARALLDGKKGHILALHVIDSDFVKRCLCNQLGDEGQIKKALFLRAKAQLRDFVREEGMDSDRVKTVVCEGVPFIEINKKAVESQSEMIVMGSRGKAGDMNTIFFGSTTEKVLRFITRPVLCVPPEVEYRRT